MMMQRVPSSDAQNEFLFIMNQVCGGLGPVLITGVHGNAVLVSEADWRRMQDWVARHTMPAEEPQREVIAEQL
jgi:prevent-host-death family protein